MDRVIQTKPQDATANTHVFVDHRKNSWNPAAK
jgi:hypothetical protein